MTPWLLAGWFCGEDDDDSDDDDSDDDAGDDDTGDDDTGDDDTGDDGFCYNDIIDDSCDSFYGDYDEKMELQYCNSFYLL